MKLKDLIRGRKSVPPPAPVANSSALPQAQREPTNQPIPRKHLGPVPHRVAFRHQRAIAIFVVLGLITLGCTITLWFHYDKIFGDQLLYKWLVRGGLAVVDVIAFLMALWHVYAHYGPTKVWCFISEVAIAAMMIVHAGAVMTLEASGVQQREAVASAGEAEAKIAERDTAARIASVEKMARDLEARGKPNQAAALRQQAAKPPSSAVTAGRASGAVQTAMTEHKQETFLWDSYMRGGIYYWPSLIALFFFSVAIAVSALGVSREVDKNGNGIPDHLEKPGNEHLLHAWMIAQGWLPPDTPPPGTGPTGPGGLPQPARRIDPLPQRSLPAAARDTQNPKA